jgi:elongation factor Ts
MEITAAQVQKLREKTGLGMMVCKKALAETNGDMEKAIENLRKQGEATAAKRAGKAAREGTVAITGDPTCTLMYEVNSETDFVARNEDFTSFVNELGKLLLKNKPATLQEARALPAEAFGGRTVDAKLTELIAKIGEKLSFSRYVIDSVNGYSERIFHYVHGMGRIGVLVKLAADNPGVLQTEEFAQLGKDLAMQVAASNPLAPVREKVPSDTLNKEKEIFMEQARNSGKPANVLEKIVSGKLEKFFRENVLVEQAFIRNPDVPVSSRIAEAEKQLGAKISVISFSRFERGVEDA